MSKEGAGGVVVCGGGEFEPGFFGVGGAGGGGERTCAGQTGGFNHFASRNSESPNGGVTSRKVLQAICLFVLFARVHRHFSPPYIAQEDAQGLVVW